MKITIGDRTREFMDLLGISEYPFSSKELTEKFRIAVKLVHPDSSGKKDANTKTREVIESYKALKNLAVDPSEEVTRFYQEEVEKDLFELTEICPVCKGKKINIVRQDKRPCPDCYSRNQFLSFAFLLGFEGGKGFQWAECRKCLGRGYYNWRGGQKICIPCNGKGRVKIRCKTCKGEGFIPQSVKTVPCSECKGRGKIVLNPFNPVIPKGAVLI